MRLIFGRDGEDVMQNNLDLDSRSFPFDASVQIATTSRQLTDHDVFSTI